MSKRQSWAVIKTGVDFAPGLGVFETLRVVDGVPLFVAGHLRELERSTAALGLRFDFDFESAAAELPQTSGRWRWIVTPAEAYTLFTEEAWTHPGTVLLSQSSVRVGSHNWDARFKTLSYLSHAQAWQTKQSDDVILLNEHGHVASASRSNIFWCRKGQLFTPAHEAGCRCGVTGSFVSRHYDVRSGHYPITELLEAEEIFLTSSMKGIVSVHGVHDRTYKYFLAANGLSALLEKEIAAQVAGRKDEVDRP